MIIISDTSPITNLAAIAHLDLLRQLYEKVVIPTAVYRELTTAFLGYSRLPRGADPGLDYRAICQ